VGWAQRTRDRDTIERWAEAEGVDLDVCCVVDE
jgi:hypothetical protein